MLADAFVILTSLILGVIALTQVLAPLISNKPLFPSFRKSYQREKWLKEQLEETRRRLAELELEKQLEEQRKELIRREMEHIQSYASFTPPSDVGSESGLIRGQETPEKEQQK